MSTSSQDFVLSALRSRLGSAHVLTDPDAVAPYLVEERGLYKGSAVAVVRPGTTEDVAFVVRACSEAAIPMVAQGGNTGLVGGGVPYGGIVISLARMNRIRDLDPINASITVEAGVILSELQDAAEKAGFLFPLNYASRGSARVGGAVSANSGGIAVLAYGNTRDLILGLEVVLADGSVWKGLKALRKNNAGYDLKHLFIGSEGTLGVVTAAVLKLFPRPKSRAVGFAGLASARGVLELFAKLRQRADRDLTAFEYVQPFGLEAVLKNIPGTVRPLGGQHGAYAVIEFASTRPDADMNAEMEAALADAIEDGLVEDATIGVSEAQNTALWSLRELLTEAQAFEGVSVKHDVSVPLSRMADFVERATVACEAAMPGVRVCAFGHVGDGNIHFNLSQPLGMDKNIFFASWEAFNNIVHDIAHEFDGSIAAEHGVGLIKRDELPHYSDPVSFALMRKIKAALDPKDLLNPGKVIALSDNPPAAIP
jgi:FAD/FMN-containing dehydrogenase